MNFCERCFDIYKESDVIIVFGGVNDYLHKDAPLGKLGDKQRDTFCGSVDYLTRTIREEYTNDTRVFTPTHCYYNDGYSKNEARRSYKRRALTFRVQRSNY